jgi:hypothetical protein
LRDEGETGADQGTQGGSASEPTRQGVGGDAVRMVVELPKETFLQ